MRRTFITHTSPDFDAIGYAWLMRRYVPGFEEAVVQFMSFNSIDSEALARADSVGDIGGEYDPVRLRFDHHHLPGSTSTDTCATKMLWDWLLDEGIEVAHLGPLIEVIYQGDLGRTEPVGLHAILWGGLLQKNPITGQRLTDQEVLAIGFDLLDRSAAWLQRKVDQTTELMNTAIWQSDDGHIWAIKGGSLGTNFAAYEQGARVVIFEGSPLEVENGFTYSMGASRAPEWPSPHLGELVECIEATANQALADEVELWYRHPGGFFVGRGTPKAPNFNPPQVDLLDVARAFDIAWRR